MFNLVSAVYPEYDWVPGRFHGLFYTDNYKSFIHFASKQLNIKEMSDWERIKAEVNKIKMSVFLVSIATN